MISVVIPAFEEAEAIGAIVKELHTELRATAHEIVVIDDGSQDATGALAHTAGARVIRHPHNLGYGAALKTGIKAAHFDTIVITDADGTYPTEALPELLRKYETGFDMVVGARTGAHYRESALKSPLRLILKWLVEFTTGRKIPDINCGLRVFSRETVIPYFDRLCNTFSFTTSLTLAYMMTGKFVTYLPISYRQRVGKTKVRLFRDSLRTLQYIVQAILYYNPLKIFLLLCGAILLFFAICTLAALIWRLQSAFYLALGSVFLAVQVFCLGLLAELLKQIMTVTKAEPAVDTNERTATAAVTTKVNG